MTDQDTDSIPEEDATPQYGFFATLFGAPTIEHNLKEFLMAELGPLETALADQSTALGELATQQDQLAEQIGGLVAGQVTQAQIDALATTAQSNADAIRAAAQKADASYEPDAGEEVPPPVEPIP